MSTLKRCDICGNLIEDSTYGSVGIFNTDTYDIFLDVCEDCIKAKFDEEELMGGRMAL